MTLSNVTKLNDYFHSICSNPHFQFAIVSKSGGEWILRIWDTSNDIIGEWSACTRESFKSIFGCIRCGSLM